MSRRRRSLVALTCAATLLAQQVGAAKRGNTERDLGRRFFLEARSQIPLIDDYVLSERAMSRGLFDPDFVRELVKRHQTGGEDHAERLWALVNFEIWQRQSFDGEGVSSLNQSQVEFAHAS